MVVESLVAMPINPAPRSPSSGWLTSVILLVTALAFAAIHMAPYEAKYRSEHPEWLFTGTLSGTIDAIQYRSWMRRAPAEGMIVANWFTAEPNRPHLPVAMYFFLGWIAERLGAQPEWVSAYVGGILAFAMVFVTYGIVRLFLPRGSPTWWAFYIILLGGGLGAHLKLLARFPWAQENPILKRLVVDALASRAHVFEDYRGHYVVTCLGDTHFLAVWLITLTCTSATYLALRSKAVAAVPGLFALYFAATFLHVYEAFTLSAAAVAIAGCLWRKSLLGPAQLALLAAGPLGACTCLAWILALQSRSGIPMPTWRGNDVLISILLLSYPLGWIFVSWGARSLWNRGGVDECFLFGWLAGCTLVTLSGPFFPFPDRGTVAFNFPLYLLAGSAYFASHRRVPWWGAVLAVVLCGATPAWYLASRWVDASAPPAPPRFVSDAHRPLLEALRRANADDILVCPQESIRWIAPEYPGRHYCAHFFLTVNFARKRDLMVRCYTLPPEECLQFLNGIGARYFFVPASREPLRYKDAPGFETVVETTVGTLYRIQSAKPSDPP